MGVLLGVDEWLDGRGVLLGVDEWLDGRGVLLGVANMVYSVYGSG